MMMWLGLVLSVVCLGIFAWKAEWSAIAAAFAHLDSTFVALACLAVLMSVVTRAWRWRYLLGPRLPTSVRHRLSTTAIGFMGNSVFPGRLGEPLRCLMLSRLEPAVGFTAALATIVLERIFDLVATLAGLVLFFVLAPMVAGSASANAELLDRLRFFGWIFAGALIVACAVVVVMARAGAGGRTITRLVAAVLPAALAERIGALFDSFTAGLASFRSWRAVAWSLVSTGSVWVCIMLSDYFMMRAFGFAGLGMVHALGLMVVLCFAVALPQAPGYVGVFQIASERTLTGLYGVPAAGAQAFAIALWAVHVMPLIVAGVVALWVEGLTFADVRRGASVAEHGREAVS